MGVEQKRGEEKQIFKKRRGKLGQVVDALKKEERNYDVYIYIVGGFLYLFLFIYY